AGGRRRAGRRRARGGGSWVEAGAAARGAARAPRGPVGAGRAARRRSRGAIPGRAPVVIRRLPKDVVDRIAAGEVIERPSSVVKELVENAIDAGARQIDDAVEAGGKRLLRVADDGSGMAKDDLALAFVPHATSKLSAVDDLLEIASFGFRGEALASVGAVARARIVS